MLAKKIAKKAVKKVAKKATKKIVAKGKKEIKENGGSVFWFVIGFVFAIVGIIYWLKNRVKKPGKAKSAIWGVLTSVIVALIGYGVTYLVNMI